MRIVAIDGAAIHDRESFHDEFARVFGFAPSYGRNMDAWIDCMTYLDESDEMRSLTLEPGELLTIKVNDYEQIKARCPELATDLLELTAFVNRDRLEMGYQPIIMLAFYR